MLGEEGLIRAEPPVFREQEPFRPEAQVLARFLSDDRMHQELQAVVKGNHVVVEQPMGRPRKSDPVRHDIGSIRGDRKDVGSLDLGALPPVCESESGQSTSIFVGFADDDAERRIPVEPIVKPPLSGRRTIVVKTLLSHVAGRGLRVRDVVGVLQPPLRLCEADRDDSLVLRGSR